MTITSINSLEDFKTAKGGKPVVIKFFATWCSSCRAVTPIFDKFSESTSVKFYKVDIDAQPEITLELGIQALPTFILFKGGKRVDSFTGAEPFILQSLIDKAASLL